MGGRTILIIMCLALATALLWSVDVGRVQAEDKPSPAITGKFRDPDNVPKKRTITKADREAAARRLAEARAAMLEKSKKTQPPQLRPPQEKGGPQ